MLDTQQTILNTHEVTSHVCYIIICVQGTHNLYVVREYQYAYAHKYNTTYTVYMYIIVYLHTHILTLPSFFQLYLF